MSADQPRTTRHRFGSWRRHLAVIAVLLGSILGIATPANADAIYAVSNPTVMVITGSKNYTSHTQWVNSITVTAMGTTVCDGGTYEAWAGSVWYGSAIPCRPGLGGRNSATFYVNRWVPSGSSVCGSYWFNTKMGWFRQVACISIKV